MKRKIILLTFLALALITAATCPLYSQTSSSRIVSKSETVAFLIEQNKSANDLIEKQATRITDLENELIVERENSASISKSYDSAKIEISSLKSSNEALARAVAINEGTIALLQEDNAKQRDKLKKANKDKWKAYAVAAGIIALKFIIP